MDKDYKVNIFKGILLLLLLLVTSLYLLSILDYSYPRDRQGWIELTIILSIIPINSCIEYQSNRLKTIFGPAVIMMVGFLCFGTLAKGAGIDIASFYLIYALIAQTGAYYAIKYYGESSRSTNE